MTVCTKQQQHQNKQKKKNQSLQVYIATKKTTFEEEVMGYPKLIDVTFYGG